MKRYQFQFSVEGICSVLVDANSIEEARDNIQMGDHVKEITEWSVDFPTGFENMSEEDLEKDILNIEDLSE